MFDDEKDVLENEDTEDELEEDPNTDESLAEEPAEEPRLSRRERRKLRGQNLVAESQKLRYEAEQRSIELERRNMEMERRLNELEGRVSKSSVQEHENDLDKSIANNYKERVRLSREFSALAANSNEQLSEEDQQAYLDKVRRLDDEQYELRARKFGQFSQQQATPREPPEVQALRTRYFDVTSNQRATSWATAQMQAAIAERDIPPSKDEALTMLDDVMHRTRQKFKLGDYGKPSDATKRKYAGVGSDYSQPSGSRNTATSPLSEQEKSMARVMYSDLDEQLAFKKFAKEVKSEK